MTKATELSSLRNLIEPVSLASLFLRYPPANFSCRLDPRGMPLFYTDFDIATTLDSEIRKKLIHMPFYGLLSRLLTLRTCFAGTTVTEYGLLPQGVSPETLVAGILEREAPANPLTIIKDLPTASPLLTDDDNAFADAVSQEAVRRGFFQVEGQALAYVPLDFDDADAYLGRLSPARRKDLRRKLKKRNDIEVAVLPLGDRRFSDETFLETLYAMYLEVFNQSEIHFDLLLPEFFTALLRSATIKGLVVCYTYKDKLAGYNICLLHNGLFIDKYIGFRYPLARECNLYFISWMVNLELAKEYGCSAYVAGWTDPEVKAALGARFTFTRHLVWVRNPLLRRILNPLRGLFESDSRVVKDSHA